VADWEPDHYARFRDLRLRPALDLLAQVPAIPDGPVVDLGCGDGAASAALRARFPGATLIGVDSSPAMLDRAKARAHYDRLIEADIARWHVDAPAALIFSNAALHWLGDHAALLPRLAGMLAPGGTLAVQMPRQHAAPSHRLLHDIAADMFPDRWDAAGWFASVAEPTDYCRLLAPLGAVGVWQTDYVQCLMPPPAGGHPVRHFTEATAMRPYLERLNAAEAQAFTARYESALRDAYPPEADGSVLFPFRRLFLTLTR
jgi:trans-aconitate 2-methyltransferase